MKESMNIDQAAGLRKLIAKRAKGIDLGFHNIVRSILYEDEKTFVMVGCKEELVSFCNLTANLAATFAKLNKRIVLFDAHPKEINTSLILGLKAPLGIKDFVKKGCQFDDIIYDFHKRLKVVRDLEAIQAIYDWDTEIKVTFFKEMEKLLNRQSDIILINEINALFSLVLKNVVIVISPSRDSIVNGYKNLKSIFEANNTANFYCLVNNAYSPHQAGEIASKFIRAAKDLLDLRVEHLGSLVLSPEVIRSIKNKKPFVQRYSCSKSSTHIRQMAQKMIMFSSKDSSSYKEGYS
ncbi:MAG: hypothetical protein GF375_03640 [Candidatus Omnitrophica bacterium]|nr:hypothetical protein [Candidatus Omnitrophota bacterium]MBD3269152.1 hypothetical protein [Candidatus Omnitrophota bacterium]